MTHQGPDLGVGIGSLNENQLHAALKEWYQKPGDKLEVAVDGYIIDVVRGDQLIEIQTRGFSALRRKLHDLAERYPVRLVHPIAREKLLVKVTADGSRQLYRRRSPKRGRVEDLFAELVSFPGLISHPNFSLEILLIQEEELRRHEPGRAWRRRGWVTHERRLLKVFERQVFQTLDDLATLLPSDLPEQFTTADIAERLGRPRRLGQQMAYCLREAGAITPVGHLARSVLYERELPAKSRTRQEAPSS
jgi:hypothetical protein